MDVLLGMSHHIINTNLSYSHVFGSKGSGPGQFNHFNTINFDIFDTPGITNVCDTPGIGHRCDTPGTPGRYVRACVCVTLQA